MFATLKMLAVYLFFGTLAGVVGIPYSMLVKNTHRLYRVVMWIMRTGIRASGITVQIVGLERVPVGKGCIFMSNHVSNLDPPVTIPALPGESSVMLKKELTKIPLLGAAMRLGRYVPVDRGSTRSAAQESMRMASDVLRSGLHLLVYPEGTRSRDGRLAPFKKGPFFLAQQTGAPVVPIVISGTQTMMQKGSIALSPGAARLEFLEPIDPKAYAKRDDLMKAVHEAIAAALPEAMRPEAVSPEMTS